MRTVGFRRPFAGRQSLLEQLRVESIEATGGLWCIATYNFDVTAHLIQATQLEFWNMFVWQNGLTVSGQPSSNQIGFTSTYAITVGMPWRVLARPTFHQVAPREFPLPQSGTVIPSV